MLYLVQHGEAVSKEEDPDRPLSTQGESDVTQMAAFLANTGISVDRIVHSGKTRAKQTAGIFAKFISENGATEAVKGINPNDSVEAFADQLEAWNTPTMVVGHLPFMAKMVSHLMVQRSDFALLKYQPGSVVCMAKDDEGKWLLQWMVIPTLLT